MTYSVSILRSGLWLFLTAVVFACHTGKPAQKPVAIAKPVVPPTESFTLSFADTLLENKYPKNLINTPNILSDRSKMRSTHFSAGFCSFNIGLVDFNGNGQFRDQPDQVTITVPDNRAIRINGDFGTPHCAVKDSIWIYVDSVLLVLTDIKPDGSQATLHKPGSYPRIYPDLVLQTQVENLAFNRYTHGALSLDSVVALKPFTFVFFWNSSRIVEYQVEKLKEIEAAFPDKINLIGVHCKEHELDKDTESNFFKMMAYPWCGTYCTLNQYNNLNQDYAWFRGLLICRDKRILFPHMSPKELQQWLVEVAPAFRCR